MKAEVRPLKMVERLPGIMEGQNVLESKPDGRLIAWVSDGGPSEIVTAMDILPVNPIIYIIYWGNTGRGNELCQRADALGYSFNLCSVGRAYRAATLSVPPPGQEDLSLGSMPKPDILICHAMCAADYKTFEMWSRFFDVPLLVMEKTFLHDGLSKEEIAHVVAQRAEELLEIVTFLERFTGRRCDYDWLSKRVADIREASKLWVEAMEMCRNVPAPMNTFEAFMLSNPVLSLMPLAMSTPPRAESDGSWVITFYQELKAELTERIANNVVSSPEKYRLYWHDHPLFTREAEITAKFLANGAVPVVGQFAYLPFFFQDLDPEKPLQSIVERCLYTPTNLGVKRNLEFVITGMNIDRYSVDGIVAVRDRTCQLANTNQDSILKPLADKTGLPVLVLDNDCLDSRFYSDSDVNNRLDSFIEILEKRGSRKG